MEIIQLIGKTLWLAIFVEVLFLANRKLAKGIFTVISMTVNTVLVLLIVLYAVNILKLLGLL